MIQPHAIPQHHIPAHVGRYLARDLRPSATLPRHVADYFERQEDIRANQGKADAQTLREIAADLDVDLADFAARRRAEQLLGAKVEEWAEGDPQLSELAYKLNHCRTQGTVGVTADGALRVAWDVKCNQSKLCPDEERQEQRRLDRRYVPHMAQWLKRSTFRKAYYCVFTLPNAAPGTLADTQKSICSDFARRVIRAKETIPPESLQLRRVMDAKAARTETERRAGRKVFRFKYDPDTGRATCYTSRATKRKAFGCIKGALSTLEAPLSARRDWNVHLNVMLLVDGYLDWKKLRAIWGHNVEIREIEPNAHGLAAALREVLKYTVQLVPTKSAEKRARHATNAPAMIEWTRAEFVEWLAAQSGFRRTRSYLDLYKLRDEDSGADSTGVLWLGSVRFTDAGSYYVDLIPADNFFGFSSEKGRRGILDECDRPQSDSFHDPGGGGG